MSNAGMEWRKDGSLVLPLSSEDLARSFAEKLMIPTPMVAASRGPKEASRHWDWKASSGSDIILPIEPKHGGLKADYIIFDEYADIKEDADIKKTDWKDLMINEYSKEMMEGSFATALEPEDSVLTIEKLREATELIKESDMARKIPKKKTPRGDPRKANYNGRMFGNILLSTTQQISDNTTLNDAMFDEGACLATVEELIAPLFEEFITVNGNKWQVIGPMKLSAQSVESGKWKSVSALGGETLLYHSVVVGKRDGICIKWTTGNIVGMDEEMMLDTTIKGYGDKLVSDHGEGNPANRPTIIDTLLNFAGESDIVTAAEEAKERVRVIVAKQLKEDISRKSEAYGENFGSWA